MEKIIKYSSYKEYKEKLDSELQQTTEGFVKIGYLLKIARDTDILQESGYASVNEFAKAEYGIDKTLVSRFVNINDRFSEGGYSEQLKEQYRGFGYAKLAIMLQLPDEINEEISPEFSKAEVQAIKDETDAEKKISDIEVILEGVNEAQSVLDDSLHKVMHQLGHDSTELYVSLHDAVKKQNPEKTRGIHETMAPAGESIYSVRIQGTGRLMLSIKDMDKDITLTNIRSGEKEYYTWVDVVHAVQQIMDEEKEPEESWEAVYGEKFPKPEKPEIAPVQQQKEEKRPASKKTAKVTKATTVKKKEETPGVEKQKGTKEEKESYPQENDENREIVPAQLEAEREGAEQTEPIYQMRKEAEEYLEKVQKAMEENKYLLARTETRNLMETLNEIIETLDQKPVPGQEQMKLEGS